MKNMEKIIKQLSFLLMLVYLRLEAGHSELIAFPRDNEVLVNHSTYFNCSTSIRSEQIHWYHYRVGENKTIYVYYKGQFNQIYADRYSVAKDTVTGEYNLIIRSVQPEDGGRYECQDDGGLGNFSSAELIVLDSTPICQSSMEQDGLVGPNSCGLHIDELHLSCSVSYSGNIPPALQWKMEGDDAPISKGIAIDYSGNRVTMNLTMSCEVEIDRAIFTCSNTRSHDKQYSCSTDPVKINYKIVAVIVPLVIVIGLILVIAIMAAIVCSKKRRKARRKPGAEQETAALSPMLSKPQQPRSSVDNDPSKIRPKDSASQEEKSSEQGKAQKQSNEMTINKFVSVAKEDSEQREESTLMENIKTAKQNPAARKKPVQGPAFRNEEPWRY